MSFSENIKEDIKYQMKESLAEIKSIGNSLVTRDIASYQKSLLMTWRSTIRLIRLISRVQGSHVWDKDDVEEFNTIFCDSGLFSKNHGEFVNTLRDTFEKVNFHNYSIPLEEAFSFYNRLIEFRGAVVDYLNEKGLIVVDCPYSEEPNLV